MIEFSMTRKQLAYWASGMMTIPVLLFSTGIVFGLAIGTPQSETPANALVAEAGAAAVKPVTEVAALEPIIPSPAPEAVIKKQIVSKPLADRPSAKLKPLQPVSKATPYAVQVGSFVSRHNAGALVERLAAKGYTARIDYSADNGRTPYKVLIGRYANRAEARLAAARFTKAHKRAAFVAS